MDKGSFSRRSIPAELLGKTTTQALIWLCCEDWAIILASWLVLQLGPMWLYPLLLFVLAGRFHSLGVIIHDAAHMPMREKTWGLRIVEILAGFPIATTLNAMKYHHLRHHRDSCLPTDPYFKPWLCEGSRSRLFFTWLLSILLVPVWTIRAPFGLAAYLIPKLRNSYATLFLQDRTRKDLTHSSEVISCARAEFGQVFIQSLVLIFGVMHPAKLLYGYLIPITITGLLAGYRLLQEHGFAAAKDRSVESILKTTNDHSLGRLGQVLLAPRNVGYHIIHHLHPQVALQNLPRLREWYLAHYPEIYPKEHKGSSCQN